MENITGNSFDNTLMIEGIYQMSGFGPSQAGCPADNMNKDFLMEQMRNFGIEAVHKEPIPIIYRQTQKIVLDHDEDQGFKPLKAQWIPFSAYTPNQGIEGNMVYADPKISFGVMFRKGKLF